MYTEFYGLDEKPFALLPDPRFLYLGSSHREALAHLLYGIEEGEGFILVVGQVGTGKTTLCRTLLDRVGHDVDIAFIFNPSRTEIELLTAINREFGLPTAGKTRSELTEDLNEFLLKGKAAGRRMILVIDEAQNLSADLLEQVRLLSNLETEREKLLQIVLIGQPELEENLAKSELRQLRQRITVRWDLVPFDRTESDEYINHRLRVAGRRTGRPLFTAGALRALHRESAGIPRVINAIADRALLAGYTGERERIDRNLVRTAARELSVHPRRPQRPGPLAAASALGGVAVTAAVAFLIWSSSELPERASVATSGGDTPLVEASPPSASPAAAPATTTGSALSLSAVAEGAELRLMAPRLAARGLTRTAADALAQVLYLWGYARPIPAEVDPNAFAATISEVSPLRLLVRICNLQQIARLNRPVILELVLPGDELRYVALQRLDPDGAAVVTAVDRVFVIPSDELYRFWSGRTFFVWKNSENVPTVELGAEGSAVRWVQVRLANLGHMQPGDPSGLFDARTEEAVREFQARYMLEPTGRVGPESLIALYEALGYAGPRLWRGVEDVP